MINSLKTYSNIKVTDKDNFQNFGKDWPSLNQILRIDKNTMILLKTLNDANVENLTIIHKSNIFNNFEANLSNFKNMKDSLLLKNISIENSADDSTCFFHFNNDLVEISKDFPILFFSLADLKDSNINTSIKKALSCDISLIHKDSHIQFQYWEIFLFLNITSNLSDDETGCFKAIQSDSGNFWPIIYNL